MVMCCSRMYYSYFPLKVLITFASPKPSKISRADKAAEYTKPQNHGSQNKTVRSTQRAVRSICCDFSTPLISQSHGERCSCKPWDQAREKKKIYPRNRLSWASKSVHTQTNPSSIYCICHMLSILLSLIHLFSICTPCPGCFFFHSMTPSLSLITQLSPLHLIMHCQKI